MCIDREGYEGSGPYIICNTATHNYHPHCPIITTVIICLSGGQYFIVNRCLLWCYVVSSSVDRQAVRSLYPIRYQGNGHDGLQFRPGGNAVRVLRWAPPFCSYFTRALLWKLKGTKTLRAFLDIRCWTEKQEGRGEEGAADLLLALSWTHTYMCLGSKCHMHASGYRSSEILGFHSNLCYIQVFWNVTQCGLVNSYGRQNLALLGRPSWWLFVYE